MEKKDVYVEVCKDGPYLIHGDLEVIRETIVPNDEGTSWKYERGAVKHCDKDPTALCRCGNSANAPCCDGTHKKVDWDGQETAGFGNIEDLAEAIEGPNLTLLDNEAYCAYARFCDAKGRVWNLVQEGDDQSDQLAIQEAANCPAGRLMIYDKKSGKRLEPQLDQEIAALEDPAAGCSGPLYLKGGIRVQSQNGKSYQLRNRQTLCRCGQSANKPFCDGTHASMNFEAGFKSD